MTRPPRMIDMGRLRPGPEPRPTGVRLNWPILVLIAFCIGLDWLILEAVFAFLGP